MCPTFPRRIIRSSNSRNRVVILYQSVTPRAESSIRRAPAGRAPAESTEEPLPEGIPAGSISFRINGVDGRFAEPIFAMLDDRRELGQSHEFERFHQVLF